MAELSHPLIVLLVILGAGFCVLMGYAIWRSFHGAIEDDNKPISDEQMTYMVSVKHRNWQALERAYGGRGGRRIFRGPGMSPPQRGEKGQEVVVEESGLSSREDYY